MAMSMRAIMGLVALALAWSAPASGVKQTLTPTDQATITDSSGESRMLVLFEGVTDLQNEWIQSATLHFPLSSAMPADMDLMIDVPRSQWNSGASWTSPWTRAGGDPYDEQAVVRPARAGLSGVVSMDVTHLVRSMAAGEIPEHGFMVWPVGGSRVGLSTAELAAFGSRSQASLEITYRKLSAHYKAGRQEILDRKRASRAAPEAGHP
jgi:hypothetical protein